MSSSFPPAHLHNIVQDCATPMFCLDNGSNIVFVNKGAYELLGYEQHELLGKHFSEVDKDWSLEQAQKDREAANQSDTNNTFAWLKKDKSCLSIQGDILSTTFRNAHCIFVSGVNVTSFVESHRQATFIQETLLILNQTLNTRETIRHLIELIREFSGMESVAIRYTNQEGDFPYYEYLGFAKEPSEEEQCLLFDKTAGRTGSSEEWGGDLECFCGQVLMPDNSFTLPNTTPYGSFWTNDLSELLLNHTSDRFPFPIRTSCSKRGYRSMLIVPIKAMNQTIGLLKLNDSRAQMLSTKIVQLYEEFAASIGITLARIDDVEALQYSELRFMEMLKASPDPILLISDDHFIDCNLATATLLGFSSRDDFLRTHPAEISPPNQPDGRDSFEKANEMMSLAYKKGFLRFEWMHQRVNGKLFPVEVSLTPMIYRGETMLHCVWRDLSIQKQLEVALIQAQKSEAIGTLAAGIAHEINTPAQFVGDNLSFIKSSWENLTKLLEKFDLLLRALKEHQPTADIVDEIAKLSSEMDLPFIKSELNAAISESCEGIMRISNIVRAMKNFAHPGSSERTPSDLNNAIRDTVAIARNEWKYVAKTELDLAPDLPLVPCLLSEFNQSVLNLIVNSAQALKERQQIEPNLQGVIKIRTYQSNDHVHIEIADNGGGIPEQLQSKIFDQFFTTKAVGTGSGQGLPIVWSTIVNKLGGKVFFSNNEMHGATFLIELPL